MSFFKEIPTLTEEEWNNLHITDPLVKTGEDRETKLAELVDKWCTHLGPKDGGDPAFWRSWDDYSVFGACMLDRVALWDANTKEPIDFGDLLRMVETRLRSDGAPEEFGGRHDLLIALRCCRIDLCNAVGCTVRPRFICGGCKFVDDASFLASTFGDGTSFASTMFGDVARFDEATFGAYASFASVSFACAAIFRAAKFGYGASFQRASFATDASNDPDLFGDSACFDDVEFGGRVSFALAEFGGWASFDGATFRGHAFFRSASFVDTTSFESATFFDLASFDSATFGGPTYFSSASFGPWASFESASFGGRLHLARTRFRNSCGVTGAMVRTAKRSRDSWRGRVGEWVHRKAEDFSWSTVGALGRMPVLARVSYLALVVVPLVAGVWPSVRGMTRWAEGVVHDAATAIREERVKLEAFTPPTDNEKILAVIDELRGAVGRVEIHADELKKATSQVADRVDHLPFGWALAFCAALFAAVGHFIYAMAADERVRESTAQAFRKQRNDEFASGDRYMHRDRLRRAFPHLKQVARLLPYSRHPDLVSRNSEAVWLPSTPEVLEQIPNRLDEMPGAEAAPDHAEDSTTAARETEADSVTVDSPQRSEPRKLARGEAPTIPHARPELEQIIIDEGARAEYDLAARERMPWAYVSGSCYLAAGLLVLWLVYIQLNVVMRAAGFEGWTHWVLRVAVVGAAAAIVYAARKSIATFWTVAFQWARRLTARSSPETAQPAASSTDAPDADDE